jgi:hypothetical protein
MTDAQRFAVTTATLAKAEAFAAAGEHLHNAADALKLVAPQAHTEYRTMARLYATQAEEMEVAVRTLAKYGLLMDPWERGAFAAAKA